MNHVQMTVKWLNMITGTQYQMFNQENEANDSPNAHRLSFQAIQGSAGQLARSLQQNPNPNRDQRERIEMQFARMMPNVDFYYKDSDGASTVLLAFNHAFVEWLLVVNALKTAEGRGLVDLPHAGIYPRPIVVFEQCAGARSPIP